MLLRLVANPLPCPSSHHADQQHELMSSMPVALTVRGATIQVLEQTICHDVACDGGQRWVTGITS